MPPLAWKFGVITATFPGPDNLIRVVAVSYTHLDVYKRQLLDCFALNNVKRNYIPKLNGLSRKQIIKLLGMSKRFLII